MGFTDLTCRQVVLGESNIAGRAACPRSRTRCSSVPPSTISPPRPGWMTHGRSGGSGASAGRAALLEDQKRLLGEELRITSQRVNLFEKVKIPECKENIRVIRIALGDAQTAGVARAKMAKGKGDDLVSGVT